MTDTTQIIEPPRRGIRLLLVLHGIVTLAAGIVLVAAPGAIPSLMSVELAPGGFVICYFLAGAQFSIASLSLYAAWCHQAESLSLAILAITVFHLSTAALEAYALIRGVDAKLWGNVALRIIVAAAFSYCALLRARANTVDGCGNGVCVRRA